MMSLEVITATGILDDSRTRLESNVSGTLDSGRGTPMGAMVPIVVREDGRYLQWTTSTLFDSSSWFSENELGKDLPIDEDMVLSFRVQHSF